MAPPRSALSHTMQRIAMSIPADKLSSRFQLSQLFLSLAVSLPSTPKAAMAVEAVRSLGKNELMKKYALTEKTLKPDSVPFHYERIVEGVDKASRGISRPWWKRFLNIS